METLCMSTEIVHLLKQIAPINFGAFYLVIHSIDSYNICHTINMKYRQPSDEEIILIKEEHQQEKDNLKMLELIVEYHINNPDLAKQRNIVKKLKDKLILHEAFNNYHRDYKPECMFHASEYCKGKINHNFHLWTIYGNCCLTCNKELSHAAVILINEEEHHTKSVREEILKELEILDGNES